MEFNSSYFLLFFISQQSREVRRRIIIPPFFFLYIQLVLVGSGRCGGVSKSSNRGELILETKMNKRWKCYEGRKAAEMSYVSKVLQFFSSILFSVF